MRSLSLLFLISTLLAGCTGTRTAADYDPSRSHRLSIVRTGSCPDTDVIVIVDGKEHRFLDGQESLLVTVPEGEHTIVHYVGNYRMQQWKAYPVTSNSVLSLACSRGGATRDAPSGR